MKKIILAALLAVSLPAAAASPYDGVYNCIIKNKTTGSTDTLFSVVMSKDNGEAFFTVAAPAKTGFFGFTFGKLNGNILTDSTDGQTITLGQTWTIDTVFNAGTANAFPAALTCFKLW